MKTIKLKATRLIKGEHRTAGAVLVVGKDIDLHDAQYAVNGGYAVDASDADASDETVDGDDIVLTDLTVDQLKELAAEYQIEGIGSMKKAELIDAIELAADAE